LTKQRILRRHYMQPAQKERAIELLLAGATIFEIAKQLQIHHKAVWHWTQHPEVANELQERRAARRYAYRLCQQRHNVKIKASIALLDHARKPPPVKAKSVEGVERWPEEARLANEWRANMSELMHLLRDRREMLGES
jgi:hypothetical protein